LPLEEAMEVIAAWSGTAARDTVDRLVYQLLPLVHAVGLVILSMSGEGLDTCNPTSKLMLTILAGVAA
jgi:DNA invertase Pin-like site-specific DNA recombinase